MYLIKIHACFQETLKKNQNFLLTTLQKKLRAEKEVFFERAQLFFSNHELRARAARFEGRSG